MANTRRREKTEERGPDGMPIWARFTLSMALALTVVSAGAGFVLYQSVRQLSSNVQTDTMVAAVTRTAPMFHAEIERQRLRAEREVYFALEQQVAKDVTQTSKDFPEIPNEYRYEGVRKAFANYELGLREALKAQREQREARYKELNANTPWQTDGTGIAHGLGDVIQAPVKYADGTAGVVYQYKVREGQPPVFILLPDSTQLAERSLFGLVVGITLVIILVGAAVSLWVANQVSGPIVKIVDDVRVIAGGNLNHRVSAQAGGEVGDARARHRPHDQEPRRSARQRGRARGAPARGAQSPRKCASSCCRSRRPSSPGTRSVTCTSPRRSSAAISSTTSSRARRPRAARVRGQRARACRARSSVRPHVRTCRPSSPTRPSSRPRCRPPTASSRATCAAGSRSRRCSRASTPSRASRRSRARATRCR
jgi:HAMP domain-containing protein